MPTALTAPIENDPNFTMRDFALRCARQLDVFFTQYYDSAEDPAKLVQEVPQFHVDRVFQAKTILDRMTSMSDAEWQIEAEDYAAWLLTRRNQETEEAARYDAMRAAVDAWQIPTPDHGGLKGMMLSQIDLSHPYRHGRDTFWSKAKPKKWNVLKADRLTEAQKSLDFATARLAETERRVATGNEYAAALYASFEAG